jgi:hypothetical protein
MTASASIAALINNCTAQEAMTQATSRFRSVCASVVSFDFFLVSPASDTGVGTSQKFFYLAEPTRLGKCDAFLSHSWHDNSEARWLALQQWRGEFIDRAGREPRIWFDKCCIDQTDIEQDLAGLPVFVSGCRQTVVLCGTTYLTRLWCIMELFTLAHMGGNKQRMTVLPVIRAGYEVEDSEAIRQSLRNFDARQCDCSRKEDKDRMLDVICTVYGTIDNFNVAVRDLFREIGFEKRLHHLQRCTFAQSEGRTNG